MSISPPGDPCRGEQDARVVHVDHAQATQAGDHGTRDNRFMQVNAGRDALVAGRDFHVQELHIHVADASRGINGGLRPFIAGLTDPFALEVHRPITVGSVSGDLPVLPPYIQRVHDAELAEVIARAADGRSGMAVLVGGSSTGKTRACWEAIHSLPPGWRLWHPFDPTPPEALLADLAQVDPRTVIWLNDTQLYLDTAGDTGERVAAALRTLLADQSRAPVLVLGTLWPGHWDTLTRAGQLHQQARAILTGTDISVPPAFAGSELADVQEAATSDPRLAAAVEGAADGQITQYLAGVPELMSRYRHAPPAAQALIHAAMDACRLGHQVALPLALLEAAAPAYLTDAEWDAESDDWLEQALSYTTAPCKGVPGLLTRLRARPLDSRNTGAGSQEADQQTIYQEGTHYRLADYLDQYGLRQRAYQLPPAELWAAAAIHAHRSDQAALAYAAKNRGLYRAAAQLYRRAVAQGSSDAARDLIDIMYRLYPADHRPARFAAAHITFGDLEDAISLLDRLREAGADEPTILLADRAAAYGSLKAPIAVARLLRAMLKTGASTQVLALADRAAASISLNDPDVVLLMDTLQKAGAYQQATMLADRAAASVPLNDPDAVATILGHLLDAGTDRQVSALLVRNPATHADLDNPRSLNALLGSLSKAGADEQVKVLADRATTGAPLQDRYVGRLLNGLRKAGADQQAAVLADRAAASVPLNDPILVATLLNSLRKARAKRQVSVLLARDPATHADLGDPGEVATLVDCLRMAGAGEQAMALAHRAADAFLDDPFALRTLLSELQEINANHEAMVIADHAAAHARLDDPHSAAKLLFDLLKAGAKRQVSVLLARDPAAQANLSDPDGVLLLLNSLQSAGADQQFSALLAREPAAHVDLGKPAFLANLLRILHRAGADQQVSVLAHRASVGAALNDPGGLAFLLNELRRVGADQQAVVLADRASVGAVLNDAFGVDHLFGVLERDGTPQQANALSSRLAAAGWFIFSPAAQATRFRFGQESDGKPTEPWSWDDLD